MRKVLLVAGVTAITALASSTLHAQARFGGQVSWADDADVGIGARVIVSAPQSLRLPRVDVIGSFDWFFPGGSVNYFEVNGNVAYRVPGTTGVAPYVGGGLNVAHSSVGAGATDLGLNLLGGIRFGIGPTLKAFSEARIEVSGGEQLVLTFGVLF